jgi:hypothetical protein
MPLGLLSAIYEVAAIARNETLNLSDLSHIPVGMINYSVGPTGSL